VALTFADKLQGERTEQQICEDFAIKLGVSPSECFPIVNALNRFEARNLQYELQLVKLLKEALFRADQNLEIVMPWENQLKMDIKKKITTTTNFIELILSKNIVIFVLVICLLLKMLII